MPTSEVHTNWGTAGNGLKPQLLHIDGEFWKPQGIQAALYQGVRGNPKNYRQFTVSFRKLSANWHLPSQVVLDCVAISMKMRSRHSPELEARK